MRRHRLQPDLDQGRRDHRGEHDIDRRRRHPHAEDDRDQGGHHQHPEDPGALPEFGEDDRELEGEPGRVQDAHHHARPPGDQHQGQQVLAGAENEVGPFRAARQASDLQEVEHEQRGRGIHCRQPRVVSEPEQEIEQHPERQQEHPARKQHRQDARQLRLGEAHQAEPRGDGVDLEEQHQIVERRRNRGGDHHVDIGDFEELGDDERRRPHHRRGDLPAVGGHRLDPGGVARLEPGALHHRDGDDPGRHDVADRRSRDGAEGAGGDDGDLGRPAPAMTHQPHGEVGEEPRRAGDFQQLAEDDEGEHKFGDDAQHQPRDAVIVGVEVEDRLGRREDLGLQRAGQHVAEIGVDDHHPDQGGDHLAAALPERLHHGEDRDHAGHPLVERPVGHADDPVLEVPRHPEPGGKRNRRKRDFQQPGAGAVGVFEIGRGHRQPEDDAEDLLEGEGEAEAVGDREDPEDPDDRHRAEAGTEQQGRHPFHSTAAAARRLAGPLPSTSPC